MNLHCLGTAGYHPSPTRQTSCYLIPESSLILDAGSGMFRIGPHLKSDHVDILLSHAHLDHVMGLTFLLGAFATSCLKSVRVFAEQKKLDALRQHLYSELIFPVEPSYEEVSLESLGNSFDVGKAKVKWFPLEHPGGSVGYRIDWPDFALGYVTDTTTHCQASYWSILHDVDLLLHECNFLDSQQDLAIKTGHSWTSAVLECVVRSQIRRVVLGHISPYACEDDPVGLLHLRECRPELFKVPVDVAEDQCIIPLANE